MILDSLTQAVGNTPMVRLRSLEPPGVEIHAKLEWFNPGGSVKDRAALRMVQEAVSTLRGRTLLDSTSGNTGIAYAWIGAALHIPVALVMPGNVSEARKRIARHFGARIIFSDALEQSDGAIRLARKLVDDAQVAYAQAHAQYQAALEHQRAPFGIGGDRKHASLDPYPAAAPAAHRADDDRAAAIHVAVEQ